MSIKGQSPDMLANSSDTIAGIAMDLSELSSVKYLDDIELSDGLLSGSIKNAAVIACSDMGCSVPYVCSSGKVQLFLFQNFGHGFATGGFIETVVKSGIETVIVYGHSACRYTRFVARAACDQQTNQCRSAGEEQQLQLYAAALETDSESLWEEVGRYNVLLELKSMLGDKVIGRLAARGRLKVHGWFFKTASRQLEIFDPGKRAFTVPHTKSSDRAV